MKLELLDMFNEFFSHNSMDGFFSGFSVLIVAACFAVVFFSILYIISPIFDKEEPKEGQRGKLSSSLIALGVLVVASTVGVLLLHLVYLWWHLL